MPIKMGTATYWVDVVDKKPEVPEGKAVTDHRPPCLMLYVSVKF